jgi:hypothetical protein
MSIVQHEFRDARRRMTPSLLSADGRIARSSFGFNDGQMRALCMRPLSDFGLTPRAMNGFAEAGIRAVGDIVDWSERDLCAIRGFGPSSLRALRSALLWLAIAPERVEAASPPQPAQLPPTDLVSGFSAILASGIF